MFYVQSACGFLGEAHILHILRSHVLRKCKRPRPAAITHSPAATTCIASCSKSMRGKPAINFERSSYGRGTARDLGGRRPARATADRSCPAVVVGSYNLNGNWWAEPTRDCRLSFDLVCHDAGHSVCDMAAMALFGCRAGGAWRWSGFPLQPCPTAWRPSSSAGCLHRDLLGPPCPSAHEIGPVGSLFPWDWRFLCLPPVAPGAPFGPELFRAFLLSYLRPCGHALNQRAFEVCGRASRSCLPVRVLCCAALRWSCLRALRCAAVAARCVPPPPAGLAVPPAGCFWASAALRGLVFAVARRWLRAFPLPLARLAGLPGRRASL